MANRTTSGPVRTGTVVPFVAALPPSRDTTEQHEGGAAQPFPIDETRFVRPIPLAHIHEAYRERIKYDPYEGGRPVPAWEAALIYAGIFAGGVAAWALMYGAYLLVELGRAMLS